ncbi:hypothetical protein [Mucilaginibacter sp. R-33]|uniref:hypothetical protein n=1 Tax=unclassified Mucilaginibacter TaxID=2617802 RepID=UPI003CE9B700
MKQPKVYTFKNNKLTGEVIIMAVNVALIIFIVIKVYQHPLIALFLALLPATFLYFQVYVVRVINQFNEYDRGKQLIISDGREVATLIYQDQTLVLNRADLVRVELYEQKDMGKFGKYDYMVIYTIDDKKILITKFTVPSLLYDKIIETFLSKVPRVYFKKQFNYIDQQKFPQAGLF